MNLSLQPISRNRWCPYEMPKIKGIKCAVHYEPSAHVGGDFYDYHRIDDNRVGFLIADVAGHGIPAAIIAAMLKVAYTFYKSDFNDPSLLFQRINNVMEQYPHGLFTTACCVYIDMDRMKLYHSNAGHWPLVIWRQEEQRLITDVLYDRPLGLLPDSNYKVNEIDLHDSDRIVMYTDGILEARNNNKKIFSLERFQALIAECQTLSGVAFVDRVIHEVKKWAGISEVGSFADDVTLIVIDVKRTPENSSPPRT